LYLEAVGSSCVDIILGQTVPAVEHSLRKEVKTTVTATTFFLPFFFLSYLTLDDLERPKRTHAEKIVLRSPPEKFE